MLFLKPFFITIQTLKLTLNLQTRVVCVRAKFTCVYNLLRLKIYLKKLIFSKMSRLICKVKDLKILHKFFLEFFYDFNI